MIIMAFQRLIVCYMRFDNKIHPFQTNIKQHWFCHMLPWSCLCTIVSSKIWILTVLGQDTVITLRNITWIQCGLFVKCIENISFASDIWHKTKTIKANSKNLYVFVQLCLFDLYQFNHITFQIILIPIFILANILSRDFLIWKTLSERCCEELPVVTKYRYNYLW